MEYRILGKDLQVSEIGYVAFSPLANVLSAQYGKDAVFDGKSDFIYSYPTKVYFGDKAGVPSLTAARSQEGSA